MGTNTHKKDTTLENLEFATEKFDPYIKTIREAMPKVSDAHDHYLLDLKKKKGTKSYALLKEMWSWRQLLWGIPVGAITWFFTLDVVLGFCFLTPCLLLLIWFLFNKYIEEKTLQDMTDESKKDYFHYYAYANQRREYEVISPYLSSGNTFKFKQAFELLKEWDKDIENKNTLILKLEKNLKEMANDSENLPIHAQQEVDFSNILYNKLQDIIADKYNGTKLTFSTLRFLGDYSIYRLEEDKLEQEYYTRVNPNFPKTVNTSDSTCKNMSYIKILTSDFAWEYDQKNTISFIATIGEIVYIYSILIDSRNEHVLNRQTKNGKMNIDKLSRAVTTAFQFYSLKENKIKRG